MPTLLPIITVVLTQDILDAVPVMEGYGYELGQSVDIQLTSLTEGFPDRPPTPPNS